VCVPPAEGHGVRIHLVPQVPNADRRLTLEELMPDEELLTDVAAYLDQRRTVGMTVQLLPARYRGISVVVNLQATALADTQRVEQDAAHALYSYLNPVVGGSPTGLSDGWRFGQTLNLGELYGIMHAIEGVAQVKILRAYETDLATGEQSAQAAGNQLLLGPTELIASATHIVRASHDAGPT
jgi:hypothetical protein